MIFEGDRVGQLLVHLKNQNIQSKKDEHLYAIPKRADDVLGEQTFTYFDNERKRVMFNPANNVCITLNSIKVFPMSYNKYKHFQKSETEMIDLLERHYIYPFLLFINGRFIPWEKIRFICSQGFNYLFVHDLNIGFARLVRTIETMHLVMMPTNIAYSMNVDADDEYQTFCQFNAEGLFEEDKANVFHRIYFNDLSANVKWQKIRKDEVITADRRTKIKVFPENFFFWNSDGFYDADSTVSCFANKAKANLTYAEKDTDFGYIGYCISKGATVGVDNSTQVMYSEIEQDIDTYLTDPENAPEYMKLMSQDFDLKMSRDLLYAENRANAIDYILNYRTDLFYVLYDWHLNYFNITVDYDWVREHMTRAGHLSILRRWRGSKDYFIIVMVNGELYKYYRHHLYSTNRLLVPVTGMKDGDIIELMFFRNADDYRIPSVVKEDEYLPLSEDYYNDNTMIYCKNLDHTKDYYSFPDDGNHHFPVEYTFESKEDNKKEKKIVFKNKEFYDKDVVFAPRDTFRYYCMYVDEYEADWCKLNLGHWFDYCYDYNRYFVFYNGKRLDHDQYRMTVPCRQTTPFFEYEIYLTVPLRYGDRLEIFYLPTEMQDLPQEFTIDNQGIVTYPRSILPYMFSSRHYTFWINGKKVPVSHMHDVDTNRIQITEDLTSNRHLKITRMGTGIEEIERHFQNTNEFRVEFKFIKRSELRKIKQPNRTILYVTEDTNQIFIYTTEWHELRLGIEEMTKEDIDHVVFGTPLEGYTDDVMQVLPTDEPERILWSVDREILWDRILEVHDNYRKLINTKPIRVVDVDDDYYNDNVYTKSIMWELLREHYIANDFVDITGNILYDYWDQDMSAFEGEFDITGVPILNVMDAERDDNIDKIDRYFP